MTTNRSHPLLSTLLSLSYWFSAHSLGLLVHPYQSVRRLIREDFYKPLVYLPSVCLLLWWFIGIIIAHFNILLTLRLNTLDLTLKHLSPTQIALSFTFVWISLFLLLWQLLLLYLTHRFHPIKTP